MPGEWNAVELHDLGAFVEHRHRISRGHRLYAAGAPFESLYFVRVGSIKTSVLLEDGREQVTGFHMLGDLIGLDGIGTDIHNCAATALEDSEVCLLPFSHLEDLASTIPAMQHRLHRLLSSEVVREQHKMLMLGTMRAEEKLAWFLLDLSVRYLKRGYSASEFVLRMTREEIGSFLGLKLETVSRLFSRFQDAGLIIVRVKHVKLLDPAGLRQLIGQSV
jgi:CRP/FNR family transcriptional regulator